MQNTMNVMNVMNNNLRNEIFVEPIDGAYQLIMKKESEIFSKLDVNVNSLYSTYKSERIEDLIMPIVLDGHGDLELSNFIKVPNNYIIVTFQKDGRVVETLKTKSKDSCHCDNLYFYFIYHWMDFLQKLIHQSRQAGINFFELLNENIHIIENKLREISKSIYNDNLSEQLLNKTFVYYPDDLIQDTNIYYKNDDDLVKNLHGITDWHTFLEMCPSSEFLVNQKESGYHFKKNHIFKNYTRNIYYNQKLRKQIKLSEFLEYSVEKTGLSNKTRKGRIQHNKTKILFIITCRGYKESIKNLTFTLKSWIPENPFQYFFKDTLFTESNQILMNKINLFEIYKEVYSKKNLLIETRRNLNGQISNFSTFLYDYFAISLELARKDLVFLSYEDVYDIQKIIPSNSLNSNDYMNCYIPLRNSVNNIFYLNNNQNKASLHQSFFVPKNICGEITKYFIEEKTYLELLENDAFESLWNILSRKYIFNKWEILMKEYCEMTPEMSQHIQYMRKLFIYKRNTRNKYKTKHNNFFNHQALFSLDMNSFYAYFYYDSYDNLNYLDTWHNLRKANELIDAIKDKYVLLFDFSRISNIKKMYVPIFSVVYMHLLQLEDFPYLTPFEFAFVNYRWVDENGQSVLNELMQRKASELEIENTLKLYSNGTNAYLQNFYGKLEDYRQVFSKIIYPIQKFIGPFTSQNIRLETVLKLISQKYLLEIVHEPINTYRYIQTIPGFDVIYGKYLMDKYIE